MRGVVLLSPLVWASTVILIWSGCSGDSKKPSEPMSGYPAGEWILEWGDDGQRALSYQMSFAALNTDGSLSVMFLNPDAVDGCPMASINVPAISTVEPNRFVECTSFIAYSSSDLSEIAISPLDPLKTEVSFQDLGVSPGSTVSGDVRGELSTSNYPDLVRVKIVSASFSGVPVGGPGR